MACRCMDCNKPVECGELYCEEHLLIHLAMEKKGKMALYDEEGNPVWVNVREDKK